MEFPYQIVVFFDKIPAVGDLVYKGPKGWFPQVAAKRRFGLVGIGEAFMLGLVEEVASSTASFDITLLKPTKPAHMPVEVIEVSPNKGLLDLHKLLIRKLGKRVQSKYPDREGDRFYPHMTIEWKGRTVFASEALIGQLKKVSHLWVIKDIEKNGDSVVVASFALVE